MNARLRTKHPRIHTRLLFALVVLAASSVCAGDWPQYRGPNHDGISTETIRTNWAQDPPRVLWRSPLTNGFSSMTVSRGRAFTLTAQAISDETIEFCRALNADTGSPLWSAEVGRLNFYDGSGVFGVRDDSPRSTPVTDGDRVYVLSALLRLTCLDAATGQSVWAKDLVQEYGGQVIGWQNAASPLLEGDLVLLNCGAANQSLLAFNKTNGALVWKGLSEPITHATPVAASILGARQAIFYTQIGLVSVNPATGSLLWRHPVRYNSTSAAASPVVAEDRVYCSRAYPASLQTAQAGALVVDLEENAGLFSAAQLWFRTNALMNHWSTPVYHNGHIYGLFGQYGRADLKCVNAVTGAEMWTGPNFSSGGLVVVNGLLLILAEDGNLVLVHPNPTAYSEIARFDALDLHCWNAPAISNGRIYARGTTEAVCLDVAPAVVAPLRLQSALTGGSGGFRLLIGNEDGSPLTSNRVANIDIFASTNLTVGLTGWIKVTNSTTLTNGQLRLDDLQSTSRPRRFFRVEERP